MAGGPAWRGPESDFRPESGSGLGPRASALADRYNPFFCEPPLPPPRSGTVTVGVGLLDGGWVVVGLDDGVVGIGDFGLVVLVVEGFGRVVDVDDEVVVEEALGVIVVGPVW